ncbi:uncharacterized protein TNCV_1947851 [Trichonephila clavipes]|nr:uncharacterized protein TNCV_1947851 [Trichonephila clavipes]
MVDLQKSSAKLNSLGGVKLFPVVIGLTWEHDILVLKLSPCLHNGNDVDDWIGLDEWNSWFKSQVQDSNKSQDIVNLNKLKNCQVIYSQFGLAIYQNDHQARRRFVEWAQNEIAVVPDFHKRILFSDEAHFWLNGYVNKQNCRIWSEANPQVYVETPLHPEKLTVWCALWAGGILLQKR